MLIKIKIKSFESKIKKLDKLNTEKETKLDRFTYYSTFEDIQKQRNEAKKDNLKK